MDNSILFMLKLLATVTGKAPLPKEPADINWELIYEVAKAHGIINLVAYSFSFLDCSVPDDLREKFKQSLYERLFVSEKQNYEFDKVILAFEKAGISYMPLKGLILQELYPNRDMRSMVDADILIKQEEYEKAAVEMNQLGYSFTGESDHEYNYIKKPFIRIELHKRLIPSYNQDMYAYFGDGWKLAKKCEGTNGKYELTADDNFIYILSHFAKHYRDSGIGIKPVLDIWLFYKNYDLDNEYLQEKLQELNLYEFYKHVIGLIKAWFEDGEFDTVTTDMTTYILNSEIFGTIKNSMSSQTIRENKHIENAARFKFVKFIFPGLEKMKRIFPVLEKFPVLLPVMWIWRVLRLVLFRREKIEGRKNMVDSIDQNCINEYSAHMKTVGLDIYKGRRNL